MKQIATTLRVLVGGLFIFSGLVKAIDPLGLAYKMQEFFEAWTKDGFAPKLMTALYDYALPFAIIMITLEVVLGITLLLGYKKKLVLWALLILMLFFTFLTSYVLFSNNIRACGCFGDCIPLTPTQTFVKDVLLLLFILILMFNKKHLSNVFRPLYSAIIVLVSLILTLGLQWHVLRHLPLMDCLPYKKGNDILALRKMPANAIADKYEYSFIYEKDGVKNEYSVSNLPDSTWKFVERIQKLVQKGSNNVPLINDFSLKNSNGEDSTEALLSQNNTYYLFFVKDFQSSPQKWLNSFISLQKKANTAKRNLYVVTAEPEKAQQYFNVQHNYNVAVFSCDGTAIKTAARVVPTVFLMDGPVVMDKRSWLDIDKLN